MAKRTCKMCGKVGHNSATCGRRQAGTYVPPVISKPPVTQSVQEAVEAAEEQEEFDSPVNDEEVVEDVVEYDKPRRGLWLVSEARKKIAGKILKVKSNGTIVWKDRLNAICHSAPETIYNSGYKYVDLQPQMLEWSNNWKA